MEKTAIQIIEKPDWVSWDDIHEVLWKAHARNRVMGINMVLPALQGEEIRKRVEGRGIMFVAIDNNVVVGTGAVIRKRFNLWCGKGDYAYLCFASVQSEYSGRGIYKSLRERIEKEASIMGLDKVLFETHENNDRMLKINSINGYKKVDLRVTFTDHYNICMVKWLNGCPYSKMFYKSQFLVHKWYKKLRFKPGQVKRFGI